MTDELKDAIETEGLVDAPDTEPETSPSADAPEATPEPESNSLVDRLWETQPNPDLASVDMKELWSENHGGIARILRGINKMGIPLKEPPAGLDIAIGALEEAVKRDAIDAPSPSRETTETEPETTPENDEEINL